jgi:hypothetical protein
VKFTADNGTPVKRHRYSGAARRSPLDTVLGNWVDRRSEKVVGTGNSYGELAEIRFPDDCYTALACDPQTCRVFVYRFGVLVQIFRPAEVTSTKY